MSNLLTRKKKGIRWSLSFFRC